MYFPLIPTTASRAPTNRCASANPANTVANSGLVAVAPPAPFAIDGTGVVGYLSVNNLTGGVGLAGTLAAAVNLQATWIP